MSDNEIEIYRQRYETWRHLDKLRWQMVQILVAIGSASGIAIRVSDASLDNWFWVIVGFSIIYIAISLERISQAIRHNAITLKNAGESIGDHGLPDVSDSKKSIMYWLTLFAGLTGLLFIIRGLFFE